MREKIELKDFNNLSKNISLSLYKVYYVKENEEKLRYYNELKNIFSANYLSRLFEEYTKIIGANILNISKQDYKPEGASINILVSEGEVEKDIVDTTCNLGIIENKVVAHLDKSHITVHTYPEKDFNRDINVLRIDMEISTCGNITPITLLNNIIKTFKAEAITVDYKIRGFNRERNGYKTFEDGSLKTISHYLDSDVKDEYDIKETVYKEIRTSYAALKKKEHLNISYVNNEINEVYTKSF